MTLHAQPRVLIKPWVLHWLVICLMLIMPLPTHAIKTVPSPATEQMPPRILVNKLASAYGTNAAQQVDSIISFQPPLLMAVMTRKIHVISTMTSQLVYSRMQIVKSLIQSILLRWQRHLCLLTATLLGTLCSVLRRNTQILMVRTSGVNALRIHQAQGSTSFTRHPTS